MDSRIWKVIIAVAALHVVVLGSMFLIQHGCSSRRPPPDVARPEPAPPIPPTAPAAPAPGSVQPLPSTVYVPTAVPGSTPAPPSGPVATTPSEPLPPTVPPVAPPLAPTTKVYTIKEGETLGKIAKLEGIGVNDLLAANPGLDPKRLKIGQEIQIPVGGAGAGASAPAPEPTGRPAEGSFYTVKKGDTLSKIARAQGTTVTALKQANNLASDTIHVGQKLHIPSPAQSGQRPPREALVAAPPIRTTGSPPEEPGAVTHIVQAGETPAIIAKKYGVSVSALLEANGNPDPRKLKIGQKLIIPTSRDRAPQTGEAPSVAPPIEPSAVETNPGVSGTAVPPAGLPPQP